MLNHPAKNGGHLTMPHGRPLKTADAKLRLLEDKLNIGTWTWDLTSNEVTWSYGLFRMLGFDPANVIPTFDLFQSLIHPEDQMDFDEAIGLASDRRIKSRRFRVIRPDGSLRWFHSKAEPHMDRTGKTLFLFGVVADVTAEEEARENLSMQEKVSNALARLLKGKVWRAHPNGKLIETADWMRLTGESAAQAHDWEALAAIHPDDRQQFRDAWKQAIATGGEYALTMRVRTLNGSYVCTSSRALPLVGFDGAIEQWIGHSVFVEPPNPAVMSDSALCAAQIRAARGFLNWSAQDLAQHSGVSFSTIRRMELSVATVRPESVNTVQATFEKYGLTFIRNADGGLSINIKAPSRNESI